MVHGGGVILLQEDEVYELDLASGIITVEPDWAGLGIHLGSLNAIDKLSDSYAFSPGRIVFVPGVGMLKPQNVYEISTGGTVSTLLDGGALDLSNVDCVDVLADGRIAFSNSQDWFLFKPGGPVHIRHGDVHVYDPVDGSVIESFDGSGVGPDDLDACTLIIQEAEPGGQCP